MENQNMENNQNQQTASSGQQQNDQGQQQEKLFTQEDVNRIVGERLARARSAADTNAFNEREESLNKRELQLDAREKLADAGLPKELLSAINCNSRKEMENSIEVLSNFYKANSNQGRLRVEFPGGTGPVRTVSMSSSGSGNGSSRKGSADSDIRKAMGLKG